MGFLDKKLSREDLINKGMEQITKHGFDFDSLMSGMKTNERHLVTIYPDMMQGQPTIDGHRVTVEEVVNEYWDSKHKIEDICLIHKIQIGSVLVCCWYKARYGEQKWREVWGKWLEKADSILWQKDYKNCPYPPRKGDK